MIRANAPSVLPADADAATRREVTAILDSLAIKAGGNCRPTSGVGSHGVPAPVSYLGSLAVSATIQQAATRNHASSAARNSFS